MTGDRCDRTVAGYLDAGCPTLDTLLAQSRQLARERLTGGARALLAQFVRRLDRHMRLEEHVLFPRIEDRGGSARTTALLCREHDRLRALVADAEASLERDDTRAFLTTSHALAARLQRHHRKERRLRDRFRSGATASRPKQSHARFSRNRPA